jgi:hypothetical protein
MIKKLMQRTIIAIFAVAVLSSTMATVEAANMSVYNTPPSFVEIKIIDMGNRIEVVVDISDMNGWEDIRKVYVNATDSHGNMVESALFTRQKNRLTNFSDIEGGALIPSESTVIASTPANVGPNSPDWFKAVHERINFVFKPFSAYYVHITGLDKDSEKCQYSGPFSSEYHEPPIIENPVVPVGISLIISVAAGVGIYVHRKHSNKLAQLAEEKMGGA